VELESLLLWFKLSQITVETLKSLGNEVDIKGAYDLYFGGAQGIMLKDSLLYGGGDSRRDGVAIGY